MMLEMLLKAMQELIDGLQRRKIQWDRYEKLVNTLPKSKNEKMRLVYSLLIQAALFSEDGISTSELQEVCGISYGTLRKLLDTVRDQGLLIQTKRGRENCFEMDLNLLDEKIHETELNLCVCILPRCVAPGQFSYTYKLLLRFSRALGGSWHLIHKSLDAINMFR